MTKTPTEEALESLAMLVDTKGAHWRLTDSPEDDCVDVPVADLRLALADRARLRAERDGAVEERDALRQAAGFKPGPFDSDLSRKVILDDIAGLRPAMVRARRERDAAQDDAMLWQATLDRRPALLVRVWKRARTAERELSRVRSTLPPPVKEAEPEPVAWIPSHLLALLRRNRDHMRALVRAGRDANHDTPLYAAPPALQARVEALEGALREAQSVLAMLVEPGAVWSRARIGTYAAAKTAEAKARAALNRETNNGD